MPQFLVCERPCETAKLAGQRQFEPDVEALAAATPAAGGPGRLLSEDLHLASSDNRTGTGHLKMLSGTRWACNRVEGWKDAGGTGR